MAEGSVWRRIALSNERRARLRRAVASYSMYKAEKEKRDAICLKADKERVRRAEAEYQVDLEDYLQEMKND